MHIAMIGAGYVGLVSGTCLAADGHQVTVIDLDPRKIARLQDGLMPVFEPGLEALVARTMASGHLQFTTDMAPAVASAEVVFIAVGTPSRRGDGHADLRYVEAAAEDVARAANGYTVVVTKSTVPVGTGRRLAELMTRANPEAQIDVASNPEFLREGCALDDFMNPDRILVGATTADARRTLRRVYHSYQERGIPIIDTAIETAELAKYAANAFLATKITFINEIADLCERVGADVRDVATVMGLDPRIGSAFLRPGPGYGGSCFPKDTIALMRTAQEAGVPLRLVETTVNVNETRKGGMAGRIIRACGGSVRGKTIAIWGVAFKPNTDDMREAPSLTIIPALQDAGATIRAFDPAAMLDASAALPGAVWCDDPYAAVMDADALVLLTEWDEFLDLDFSAVASSMTTRLVVDLRNALPARRIEAAGLRYVGIGRSSRERVGRRRLILI